ncbi:MAG: DUF2628 domain-containing protein [Firmicutes bacterium]|nr:DUF2628 domain-containing protein [Bacillota bacterium]
MQNNNNGYKTCPGCKKEIGYYETVCIYCGQEFEVEYPDERAAYIQKNVDKYLRKFDKMNAAGSGASWNWCAFLFTFSWMVYRKMYGLAVIVMLAMFAIEFSAGMLSIYADGGTSANLLINVIDIVICIVIGVLGNGWYQTKVNKLVKEGAELPAEEKQQHYKKGGTNVLAVIILALISGALNLLLM